MSGGKVVAAGGAGGGSGGCALTWANASSWGGILSPCTWALIFACTAPDGRCTS